MEKERLILENMYEDLKDLLIKNKKYKKRSVFISFFQMKSNTRLELLKDSSMDMSTQLREDYLNLTKNEFIRKNKGENYYITGKGIWEIESQKDLSISKLIDFFDSKYFKNKMSKTKITNKERIILLTLVIARAFSDKYSLDLNKGDFALNACKEIIDFSNNELSKYKFIKKVPEKTLYRKNGNEHMISYLIRHTDAIPKKTNFIYTAPGQQKYYLDIAEEGKVNKQKLEEVFRIIFKSNDLIEYDELVEIFKKMNNLTYDKAVMIYNNFSRSYISPVYDEIIKESLLSGVLEYY